MSSASSAPPTWTPSTCSRAAGIRFISVAHEQNAAHMADGYSRASNRHGVCVGQNGPGITNFVTAIAAAYWAHSPVVAITPETGSLGMGLGGFQETDQLPDLLEDHALPGPREPRPDAHRRAHRPRLHDRDARSAARCRSTSRATTSTGSSTPSIRARRPTVERSAGGSPRVSTPRRTCWRIGAVPGDPGPVAAW